MFLFSIDSLTISAPIWKFQIQYKTLWHNYYAQGIYFVQKLSFNSHYHHFQTIKMRLCEYDIKKVIVDMLQIRMQKLYSRLHFASKSILE